MTPGSGSGLQFRFQDVILRLTIFHTYALEMRMQFARSGENWYPGAMTDGNSPESEARKRGRPKARERVLTVRVPASILPFLERMGHGSAESGAAIWLATHDRRERQIEDSIAASLRDLSLAARSLQAHAERYEAERKSWLRDLVRVASAQGRAGDDRDSEEPDEDNEPW